MNTELFAKIHEVITVEPRLFDMTTWEDTNACGTTRCIAGWAVHLNTNQPLYTQFGDLHESVAELSESLGIEVIGGYNSDFQNIARELLGLDAWTAARVFYISDTRAKQFVELAANGYEDEALSLLSE